MNGCQDFANLLLGYFNLGHPVDVQWCIVFLCLWAVFVVQSALQKAVTEAAQLLVFNASMFVIPLTPHEEASHHRSRVSRLSAQFSEIMPKVINYDPDKPITLLPGTSSKQLAQTSRLMLSSMPHARRLTATAAAAAVPATVQPLDVSFLVYRTIQQHLKK